MIKKGARRPLRIINSVAPIRICDNGGWTDTWFAGYGRIFNIAVYPYAEVQVEVHPLRAQQDRIIIRAENFGDRYAVAEPGVPPVHAAPAAAASGPDHKTWDRHPLLEAAIEYMKIPRDIAFEVTILMINWVVLIASGVLLSIVGLTLLVILGTLSHDGWKLASAIVYGVSLVLEYAASTLYHSFPWERAKHLFKIFDHCGIYLLIAGTYTPFTLVTLRGRGGWALFGVIWGLALLGIALEALWAYRPRWLSAAVYLGMGWMAVLSARPLLANLDPAGVWLLVAGGLAYTVGTAFYVLERVRYMHAVWHLFVLAGSACHFLAVWLFVIR